MDRPCDLLLGLGFPLGPVPRQVGGLRVFQKRALPECRLNGEKYDNCRSARARAIYLLDDKRGKSVPGALRIDIHHFKLT